MLNHDLSVLEPPYLEPAPVLARVPALGSVAVARIGGGRGLGPELPRLLDRAPWTVPCVVLAPNAVSAGVLQAVWGLAGQPAFIVLSSVTERPTPSTLLKAIASRPIPPRSLAIAYAVRRTHSVVLGETLEQVWSLRSSERAGPGNAERTLRHRLRQLGEWGRHDWIRIWRLVLAKTEGRDLNVEQKAQLVGAEARTLRSWLARYLGVSMRTFRVTAGWEWILEAALRRGGFSLEDHTGVIAPRRRSLLQPV
jgi:hypothetical protein